MRHVVTTDVNQDRLDLAGHVADVMPVNVAETDLKSVMHGLGMREGFDIGLEMSGAQPALDQMVEALVMGGRIAMLGFSPGKSPVDWSRIITHRFPVDELEKGFDAMLSGKSGKVVLDWG